MARVVELRCGDVTISLDTAPYRLLADGWQTGPGTAEARLAITATTDAERDRYVSALTRMMSLADLYGQEMVGEPVWCYAKTCDALTATAEIGATWKRARVDGGAVQVEQEVRNEAQSFAFVRLIMTLATETWERAAPVSVAEVSAASAVSVAGSGAMTVAAGQALTARRVGLLVGAFTVRARWTFADYDCIFFMQEYGTYDVKAYYQAADNRLYMMDAAGNTAMSSALTATAGDELDLVFKWDTANQLMAMWVNGEARGSAAVCEMGFVLTERLTNTGLETATGSVDDGTSDTFTGWDNAYVNDGAGNKVESTATAQAGSKAVKLTFGTGWPYMYQGFIVQPGSWYKLTFYTRGDGTKAGYYHAYLYNASTTQTIQEKSTGVTGTTYTLVTLYFQAPADYYNGFLILGAPLTAGTAYYDTVSLKQITSPTTYTVFAPSTVAQTLLSYQIWDSALTDAECAGLYVQGRPEMEMVYYVSPTDEKATNAHYQLYNAPGDAPGRLRLVLWSTDTDDQDQIRVGLRPRRIQTTHKWECEAGTLGSDTAANSNTDASGGSQARFTPSADTSVVRVTVVIAPDPDDVAGMQGEHRVLLAGYDSAGSVGVNLIKWRLVVAGQYEDFSDEYAFAAVSTRSVLDLGTLSIPPGAWPEESVTAVTDAHAGSYVTLELHVRNTLGSGGGTLDMDAVYLFPVEREGVWRGDFDVSDVLAVIDHASDPPAAVAVALASLMKLEFARWASWVGDILELIPATGAAGSLMLFWYRNGVEQAYPNDTSDVLLFYRPTWRR